MFIEDNASGTPLTQELRNAGMLSISAIKPEGGKLTRMHGQTAQIESGFILFPKKAPWLQAYLIELLSFPKGRHDDHVHSTSQAL